MFSHWGFVVVHGGGFVAFDGEVFVAFAIFLWFLDFFELRTRLCSGHEAAPRAQLGPRCAWVCPAASVSPSTLRRPPSLPPSRPPSAHLLLKSLPTYFLIQRKFSQLAAMDCCGTCSSSPRAPSGGSSSHMRPATTRAHAQSGAGVCRGRDSQSRGRSRDPAATVGRGRPSPDRSLRVFGAVGRLGCRGAQAEGRDYF